MYKNAGETIKSWIRIVTVVIALLFAVVGGGIGGLAGGDEGSTFFVAFVFFVIGMIVGYFFGMLIYAFGELVSHTIELDEKMTILLNATLKDQGQVSED